MIRHDQISDLDCAEAAGFAAGLDSHSYAECNPPHWIEGALNAALLQGELLGLIMSTDLSPAASDKLPSISSLDM